MTALPTLDDARPLLDAAEALIARCVTRTTEITDHGKQIDEHQVLAERITYAATQCRAARELANLADAAKAEGQSSETLELLAAAGIGEQVRSVRDGIEPALDDLGLGEDLLEETFPAAVRELLRRVANESVLRELGRRVCEARGRDRLPLDELLEQVRDAVREFAENEVAPNAERIHRHDELVPESFITKMSELNFFGLSVPRDGQPGDDPHHRGALARLAGGRRLADHAPGDPDQGAAPGRHRRAEATWLPRIASARVMVGISVTEPDIGSDVAA